MVDAPIWANANTLLINAKAVVPIPQRHASVEPPDEEPVAL